MVDMMSKIGIESKIINTNACFETVPQTKDKKLMIFSICDQYLGTVFIHTK